MKAHTNPQKLYCYGKDTGRPKFFTSKGNLDQHWANCKQNTNKVAVYCEICTDGPFYLPKKRNEHMRDVHGWRKQQYFNLTFGVILFLCNVCMMQIRFVNI